jgi:hypothetical protein
LASIKIPDRYKAGFVVLSALPNAVFSGVIDSLNALPSPSKGQKELTSWVLSEAKGVSLPDLQNLVETLPVSAAGQVRS